MDLIQGEDEIDEFHCSICFEKYGSKEKSPRVLACGHSLCTNCLRIIVNRKPECPTCRQDLNVTTSVESIPINLSIKSLIERQNAAFLNKSKSIAENGASTSSSSSLPHNGKCKDHSNYKQMRCMDCKIFLCGTCAVLSHGTCRVLLISKAINELKRMKLQKAEMEMNKNFRYIGRFQQIIQETFRYKQDLQRQIESYKKSIQEKQTKVNQLSLDIIKLASCMKVRKQCHTEFRAIKCKLNSAATFQELEQSLDSWSQSIKKIKDNVARYYHLHNKYFKVKQNLIII